MKQESRTFKSIQNAKVALFFYLGNLVLQFFSRKIFLDYLGAEVLGLNTTAQNLLSFLNIAELGIGTAIAFTLYKPLFLKDRQTINEIISIQGWFYRRIAYIVIAGACILMCFFPFIFEKIKLPLWYTYASFVVLLISSLLGYFFNYRQIVLVADQKEYKITFCLQGLKLIKVILQILCIRYFAHGYIYWLVIEGIMAFVAVFLLNRVIKREYPWLNSLPSEGQKLKIKYPEIIVKTKQLFFHRISWFALDQISPLIIYAYASLSVVAVYGNYILITTGIRMLMSTCTNSMGAGVGNLVAEGDHKHIKSFFWELRSFQVWTASVFCYGIFRLADSFVCLWVGPEYVLDQKVLLGLIGITFVLMSRTNIYFLEAYGLFQDIWAPVIEVLLNITLAIILGYYYGLPGILFGELISLIIITCGWKPYFLFKYGFKDKVLEYVVQEFKYIFLISLSVYLAVCLTIYLLPEIQIDNYWNWVIYAFQTISVYFIISLCLFYNLDKGICHFIERLRKILYL